MAEQQRPATPSDPPCSCGRPARVVYLTERFGDVPACGISGVAPLPGRLHDPAWRARWGLAQLRAEGYDEVHARQMLGEP